MRSDPWSSSWRIWIPRRHSAFNMQILYFTHWLLFRPKRFQSLLFSPHNFLTHYDEAELRHPATKCWWYRTPCKLLFSRISMSAVTCSTSPRNFLNVLNWNCFLISLFIVSNTFYVHWDTLPDSSLPFAACQGSVLCTTSLGTWRSCRPGSSSTCWHPSS